MSDITDWEPEMITAIDWEAQYERELRLKEILGSENMYLRMQLAEKQARTEELEETCKVHIQNFEMYRTHLNKEKQAFGDYKKYSEQEFRILKAEIITSLRAINLCLIASVSTEKQALTHRARNFRMRHVGQIIANEISRFGDRQLISYEDDF